MHTNIFEHDIDGNIDFQIAGNVRAKRVFPILVHRFRMAFLGTEIHVVRCWNRMLNHPDSISDHLRPGGRRLSPRSAASSSPAVLSTWSLKPADLRSVAVSNCVTSVLSSPRDGAPRLRRGSTP